MGDAQGFLKHTKRELPERRPVPLRLMDWKEVYQEGFPHETLQTQASRCMDCGIPFCHNGCPLGNLIPEWNDQVYRGQWREGIDRLHATNNFPEFTGRLCPAPCEASCVLGINQDPVTIKQVEVELIENAFDEGWVQPYYPTRLTGKKVAVVGSGPAGLAAAQQLTRAGHTVTVFERDDRIGGLLRYGIPEFKMEKRFIDRRLAQMEAEGTIFKAGVNVGVDITAEQLRERFDAVVLAGGSTIARDLPIPGRDLDGIHQAMEFLPLSNRVQLGDGFDENGRPVLNGGSAHTTVSGNGHSASSVPGNGHSASSVPGNGHSASSVPPITAKGKKVVIIGGGDTGADCLGTSHRQGAVSVHQFEIMPKPPAERADSTPWPTYPLMYRVSSAHEEGGERVYSVNTERFVGREDEHGRQVVTGLQAHEVTNVNGRFEKVEGTEFTLDADLVLLAMGFVGPQKPGLLEDLGVGYDQRGNVKRGKDWQTTVPGVFVAGDMGRGQSLIVWAIAEGRSAASAVDNYLEGETALPAPIEPTSAPQR